MLMIGPGTGVAPFRGFLQELAHHKAAGQKLGGSHLFFGCRNRDIDFIYRPEFETAATDGTLAALHTAFSREQVRRDTLGLLRIHV